MHGNYISKHNAECNTGMIDCVQFRTSLREYCMDFSFTKKSIEFTL